MESVSVASSAAMFEFPSTARAARASARLWFQSQTPLSPAQFRDQQFRAHCEGKTDSAIERRVRRRAFDQAFAAAIGHIVVDEGRFHALAA